MNLDAWDVITVRSKLLDQYDRARVELERLVRSMDCRLPCSLRFQRRQTGARLVREDTWGYQPLAGLSVRATQPRR